jgi:hypothetical protein
MTGPWVPGVEYGSRQSVGPSKTVSKCTKADHISRAYPISCDFLLERSGEQALSEPSPWHVFDRDCYRNRPENAQLGDRDLFRPKQQRCTKATYKRSIVHRLVAHVAQQSVTNSIKLYHAEEMYI